MNVPQRLTIVTPPLVLPVHLNEVKKQIDITDDQADWDALLQGYADAATDEAEKYTGRSLITRTYKAFFDRWPSAEAQEGYWEGWRTGPITSLNVARREFELPSPPLQSVTHIKTYDDSDVATTFDSSNYYVSAPDSAVGRIVLRTSAALPVIDRVADGLEVQFVAGYGDNPADVPEPIRTGILMTTAWLYTNRGDCEDAARNSGAYAMWRKYRVLRIC